MKIYVASLETDLSRRASIECQLQSRELSYEVIDAVDGRMLSAEDLQAACREQMHFTSVHGRVMMPAEVACCLTHLKMYQRFLQTDESHAVFLEDDAYLLEGFDQALAMLPESGLDVVMMGYPARTFFEIRLASWIEPIYRRQSVGEIFEVGLSPRRKCFGMVGVMLSRHAAEQLLACNSPITTVADDHMYFGQFLTIHHLRPLVVAEDLRLRSAINHTYRRRIAGLSLRRKLSRLLQGIFSRMRIACILAMDMRSHSKPDDSQRRNLS